MSRLFLANPGTGETTTYQDLLSFINSAKKFNPIVYKKNIKDIFFQIILSLAYEKSVTLIDSDSSTEEIELLLGFVGNINHKEIIDNNLLFNSVAELQKKIESATDWNITLFTSGTTGIPKQVLHPLSTFLRAIKTQNHSDDIWGFAYNPTHIAGLQVFLQAYLNSNPIINIFNLPPQEAIGTIKKFEVTHISATPTYYRLILSTKDVCPKVKRITVGGERYDEGLEKKLNNIFPNAKIQNIYASTEAGTVLVSNGNNFQISEKYKTLIKIINGEICLHRSMLGVSEYLNFVDNYYHTGDMVEIITNEPLVFKILSRMNDLISVGGYKVNPEEVEAAINSFYGVSEVLVFGKKNSLLGNIVAADVVEKNNSKISEKELRDFLRTKLQNFKIPRIINFVENISLTRTGKKKRSWTKP